MLKKLLLLAFVLASCTQVVFGLGMQTRLSEKWDFLVAAGHPNFATLGLVYKFS